MKHRSSVVSIVVAVCLALAGIAAANGRPAGSHGKPSVTPPPWSQGHGHGN